MTDTKTILGIASVLASFVQYVPYMADILRGKTRPHSFTWFVWGLPCGIIFAAQLLKGGAAGSWATGTTTVFCTVIFIMSLSRGEKDITKSDWLCLFMAMTALLLWGATKDPLGSVILITVADVLGLVPTARKSIRKPHEETLGSYVIGGLKWVLSIFALGTFSLTVWLYPVAMVFANWGMVTLLTVRRAALAIEAK